FAARFESDAVSRGHTNRALRRDRDLGIDEVLQPIPLAGGYVAGQREIRKRRECNIVSAADAGFKHAAAPDGYASLLAKIVDTARHRVATDAAKLDVDDLAGAEFHRGARLLFGMNAFVKAYRRVESFLQLDVAIEIV